MKKVVYFFLMLSLTLGFSSNIILANEAKELELTYEEHDIPGIPVVSTSRYNFSGKMLSKEHTTYIANGSIGTLRTQGYFEVSDTGLLLNFGSQKHSATIGVEVINYENSRIINQDRPSANNGRLRYTCSFTTLFDYYGIDHQYNFYGAGNYSFHEWK